jgi:hypothetical protein
VISALGDVALLPSWILRIYRDLSQRGNVTQPHPTSSPRNDLWQPILSIMKPTTLRPFLPRLTVSRRLCVSRTYAVQSPGNPTLQVFNRQTKYLQKERAAADVERSRQVDYLKDEVAMRLSGRLLVSFNCLIRLKMLINLGYQSPFQSRP